MVKFNTPAGSKDIVFIFLDRTYTCQNSWTTEIVKNLSDYVLSDILIKGFNVIQGTDEDQLLQEAAKDYSHAVVLSSGTEFINGDEFYNEVELAVYGTEKFFLMGHIPDRDDGYYELHEQCYIINLETYKKLKCPTVGQMAFYSEHTQLMPIRSTENIHDDYTPIWIRTGSEPKAYKHKFHGWNILSIALTAQEPVVVFSDRFRKNKKYYYPNHETAFLKEVEYLYGKYSVSGQTLFYPYNTEQFTSVDFTGPVRQLIIQSSGLQWYNYLVRYGYDENTVVRFVDYNLFALECMSHITSKWDGDVEYIEFVNNYVEHRKSFLRKGGNHWDYWITMTGSQQTIDTHIWKDIQSKVKFEFQHEDLVLNTRLPVDTWIDIVPNTIVHLSNIFNYETMAPFVPLKNRIISERLLLKKITDYIPDATIVKTGYVSKDIQCPTWHMNGDWHDL